MKKKKVMGNLHQHLTVAKDWIRVGLKEELRREYKRISKASVITEKEENNEIVVASEHVKEDKDNNKKLNESIQNLKNELTQLVAISKNKLNEREQVWLEILLEMQEVLTNNNQDDTAQKQLSKAKEKLNKKLRKGEIENICQLQEEITQLEKQQKQNYDRVTQIQIPPK
ncbi:11391_t:CDS:2 [Paraglomus brasilianum]|uniref:11391_t:CDS:1 n=1 Tax=Paraglomus brasilianum TaxID=144538 RepID=A0A9N9AX77_9GLOM|nr:11391_t:CDS:2 [Paraglomus brasilianum]